MNDTTGAARSAPPRVGLFVTCLADTIRPSVAFSTVKRREYARCRGEAPASQTC